jgi:hypothetical protein
MTTEKKTVEPEIRGTKALFFFFSFRHDAGIFRPNGVSRRPINGMKIPNPRCFGVWGVLGKKAEVQKPNRISAKCAIGTKNQQAFHFARNRYLPLSQLNNTRGSGDSQPSYQGWDVIRRSDGHTETRISSPTHRTISVMFPCQLQSFNPFVQHAASKRLRMAVLQADDSSYNGNSIITQSVAIWDAM